MKKSYIFLVIAGLLTFNLAAETVDEIIAKNIEARGGRANLDAIQTLVLTGTLKMMGMQSPMTLKVVRPDKVRIDLEMQGQRIVQAHDGETAWHIMPFMGNPDPQKLPAAEAQALAENADIDGVLVDYQDKGHQVELVGKEDVEGTQVYHLKVTQKSGRISHIYLDTENYIELKQESTQPVQGQEVDVTTYFSDYKPVNGVMMAHSLRVEAPNFTQEMTIEEIKVNEEIDESVFSMPATETDSSQ